jgi:hypothetical protein
LAEAVLAHRAYHEAGHMVAAWCVIFLNLLYPPSAIATTVMAIWTPSSLAIGADSALWDVDTKNLQIVCKIGIANSVVYSQAGPVSWRVGQQQINIMEIERRVFASSEGTLSEKMSRLEQTLIPMLNVYTDYIGWNVREYAAQRGIYKFQVIAATSTNGEIELEAVQLQDVGDVLANSADVQEIVRKSCPRDCRSGAVISLSENEIITGSDPTFWQRQPFNDTINQFISREIQAHPSTVSFPVAIIDITGETGPTWAPKGACDQ